MKRETRTMQATDPHFPIQRLRSFSVEAKASVSTRTTNEGRTK